MITSKKISTHRQKIRKLIDKINELAFYCAHTDSLIKGTPGEVFRKCGKPTCKCARDPSNRHGPYLVVQIKKEGQSKQIALRKDQKDIWQQAKNYQKQMKKLSELKICFKELEQFVREIIENRVEEPKL